MNSLRVLIIDNEDQSAEIERMKSLCARKGFNIECDQFNVGSTFRTDLLTEGKIDKQRVIETFIQEFQGVKIDLICFDFKLDDEETDGVELIRLIHQHREKTQKLLYTSGIEDVLNSILSKYVEAVNKNIPRNRDENFRKIKALIKIPIVDFVDRNEYEYLAASILEKKEESLDDMFESVMKTYPKYKTDYFDGINIHNLEQLLDRKDNKTIKLKRELVEHLVAYLIRLQDEE